MDLILKGAAVATSTSVTAGVATPALTYAGDDNNNTGAQAFDPQLFQGDLKYSALGNLYSRFNLVWRGRDLNWARCDKYCT